MIKYELVVKEDCATCQLTIPVFRQLSLECEVDIYSQDNPEFPPQLDVIDDLALENSSALNIETVPTIIK